MSDTLLVSTRKGLFTLRREKKQWAICAVDFIGDNVSIMPCNSSNGYPHDCESGQWSCAIPSNTFLRAWRAWQSSSMPSFCNQGSPEIDERGAVISETADFRRSDHSIFRAPVDFGNQ
jgi:hypothetical protein